MALAQTAAPFDRIATTRSVRWAFPSLTFARLGPRLQGIGVCRGTFSRRFVSLIGPLLALRVTLGEALISSELDTAQGTAPRVYSRTVAAKPNFARVSTAPIVAVQPL